LYERTHQNEQQQADNQSSYAVPLRKKETMSLTLVKLKIASDVSGISSS